MSESMNENLPSEADFNAVFGIEETDPAAETGTEGAQERTEETEPAEGMEGHEETQEGSEGTEMPAEERHRQAAARRAREDAAREEARAAAEQERVDAIYREMFQGQINPYTGKPINGEQDYRDYQTRRETEEQESQFQEAGIDPDALRKLIDQQTAPLRQQLEEANMAQARERAAAINRQADAALQKAVSACAEMMPDAGIQSVDDIMALPTAQEINDRVQRGYSLEDAFRLANFEAITRQSAKAARAATLNGMANRQHLSGTGSESKGLPMEIPAEMANIYRQFMPNATDAEIRAAYEREMKH